MEAGTALAQLRREARPSDPPPGAAAPPLHYGPLARINVKKVAPGREGSVHSMVHKY